jgi:hypothetical protein
MLGSNVKMYNLIHKGYGGVDRDNVVQDRFQCEALVNRAMNLK